MIEQTPPDLRYSKEHEWVKMNGDEATVGITHFAQDSLGDVVYVDLPDTDTTFEQFAKFGEIESVKAVSELYTPVGGAVTEVNGDAVDNPELVNSDPYGKGWLIRLRVADPSDLHNLLTAEAYEALLAESE